MTYQLGSAMLDAVVLSIVAEEDSYGYMISQKKMCIRDSCH